MSIKKINFMEKFSLFMDYWSPKIIAQMNDIHFKIAKIRSSFIWHSHPETDEVFIVVAGEMILEFRDQVAILRAGEMIVVPKGMEHRPIAENECCILMVEPVGTVNTGDAGGKLTIENLEWI